MTDYRLGTASSVVCLFELGAVIRGINHTEVHSLLCTETTSQTSNSTQLSIEPNTSLI